MTSTANANGTPRFPGPTWRSCWRWRMCWREKLADLTFLSSYCTGYERFERYLLGVDDGVPKSPEWAAPISGLDAAELRTLARRMAAGRTLVTVSWSLQRVRHGEQAPWMGLTLAAMLGQIGLPGGGFGHGYGSMNEPGLAPVSCPLPTFPQGPNPVETFIPVAAISELLLRPGQTLAYNGQTLTLPDIRCVYWAGGNPFHHHQNLPRLRRALSRVDTVVVHDPVWTAMAKHADIVVPSTTSLERDDFSGSRNDPLLVAMKAVAPPYANPVTTTPRSRHSPTDSDSASSSARDAPPPSGCATSTPSGAGALNFSVPSFDEFWDRGYLELPTDAGLTLLSDFRENPAAHPLHSQRAHRNLFRDHRRLRILRLRWSPTVVRTHRMAGR
ncbi:molybdopterin-dependent oxidoreductase [Mycobacteroides abscessus]|uniref:molybdopterin-dependent oxidoreductase n=1 Tax=Mycobacteroides abscessus TaxID=36809 RepID=UPI002E2E39BB|nr:molybdopterin-dependent oxidoreductase [Mycobacteroides abscessus]